MPTQLLTGSFLKTNFVIFLFLLSLVLLFFLNMQRKNLPNLTRAFLGILTSNLLPEVVALPLQISLGVRTAD